MTQPISDRVPNPTSPQQPVLPTVHVHGATSWRRRVFLILVSMVPSIVATVVGFVAPLEGDLGLGVTPSMTWLLTFWAILGARSFPPLARWSRHVSASLVGVSWALAAAATTMERDAASWSPDAVTIVVAATLTGFWLAWWVCGLRFGVVWPLVRPTLPPQTPTMRTAWSARASNTGYLVILVLTAAFGLVFFVVIHRHGSTASLIMLPIVAFALLSALPFTIRVTADRRGLRLRSRVLRIPLVTVPLERIASATAALIDETEWGQVGSTADRELTTIIHRSGPSLIVTRTDGSMVVVTVDRPDEAAAVLESLRARPALG